MKATSTLRIAASIALLPLVSPAEASSSILGLGQPVFVEAGAATRYLDSSIISFNGAGVVFGTTWGPGLYTGLNLSYLVGSSDENGAVYSGRLATLALEAGYDWEMSHSFTLRPAFGIGRQIQLLRITDSANGQDVRARHNVLLFYPELKVSYTALQPFLFGLKTSAVFERSKLEGLSSSIFIGLKM